MKQSISVFCRIKPVDKRKEGNYEISTWEENDKKEKLEIQIPRLDEAGVVNNKQGKISVLLHCYLSSISTRHLQVKAYL